MVELLNFCFALAFTQKGDGPQIGEIWLHDGAKVLQAKIRTELMQNVKFKSTEPD